MDYGGLILVCFHMRGGFFGGGDGGNSLNMAVWGRCKNSVNKRAFSFLSERWNIIMVSIRQAVKQ